MTNYPFPLDEALRSSLPPRSRDGNWYVDVKFRDRWDGILVIDENFNCIGVYVHRSIKLISLPFAPNEIEDLRSPSITNQTLALLPQWFDLWLISLAGILVLCPTILLMAKAVSPFIALLTVPVVLLSWIGMYSCCGFPLIRLPVAILGLAFLVQSLLYVAGHLMS